VSSLAGGIAAKRATGRNVGSGQDWEQAADLAQYRCGTPKQVDAYLSFCYVVAQDTVELYWP
jgi:hypothetical protein